jgi:protein required for attachment to host cells
VTTKVSLIEQLSQLARQYRHFHLEHLPMRMRDVREKFERLLEHWVDDEALRHAWEKCLYEGGPAPDEPKMGTPPLFKGLDQVGSRIEVRPCDDGGYDVVADGSIEIHETVPWHLDPDMIEPIQIHEHECREICEAPPEALRALGEFLKTPRATPSWQWARALYEDGVIDDRFGLTPRGHRLLGKSAPRALGSEAPVRFGVLAADAARARVFVLQAESGEHAPTTAPLVEISETTHPDRRARDSEQFSDTRPGLQSEGPHGPRHAVSDRREGHRRDAEKRFAAQIVKEALRVWRAHGATRLILVASGPMLGALRVALGRVHSGPSTILELARDLTRLAAPALHDALANEGLLPPRGRLPLRRPQPGLPASQASSDRRSVLKSRARTPPSGT